MEELDLMEGEARGEDEDARGSLESLEQDGACPQIWSMDLQDNLIAIGTSTGTLEFWEGSSGKFKVKHK